MFELDHDLAQDIVDRAMAILPYNVNVMDNQGLILGSGEPERINTRHEGAQLVLANGRVVEIDAQTAAHLKGVQPGINLPLLLDQRLIGVLGITGEPEQLRTYAELVRMTAEMLVGQRNQQAEQQWRRQRCDDLLALLLSDAGDSPRLIDEARQMGLKPQLARTPYLFELGLEHAGGQTVEALSAWLSSRYPDSWCVSSAKSSLLWCRPTTQTVDNERLLEKLQGLGWNILRIAVGGQADGLQGLRRCYRRVGDLLAYGRDVLPHTMASCWRHCTVGANTTARARPAPRPWAFTATACAIAWSGLPSSVASIHCGWTACWRCTWAYSYCRKPIRHCAFVEMNNKPRWCLCSGPASSAKATGSMLCITTGEFT